MKWRRVVFMITWVVVLQDTPPTTTWKVPHFEKMLYDNAQLVSLYAHAYQVTQSSLYEEVVRETLDFVKKEMMSPEGGFWASINADSEGEEGKYYDWTKTEIHNSLDQKKEESLRNIIRLPILAIGSTIKIFCMQNSPNRSLLPPEK